MQRLSRGIVNFFNEIGYVIVMTIDAQGRIHASCKGIVDISSAGRVYLFDLYQGKTIANLGQNSSLSITSVDEHHFIGYCLQGNASIVKREAVPPSILKKWDEMLTRRLTRRIVRNLRQGNAAARSLHPEALLPRPQYLIVLEVEEIIDLRPHDMRGGNHG